MPNVSYSLFQEGPREPGVVYLGEEEVNVVLDPGNIACLNEIDNDMSCTATIKEDGVYRVKITRANEVGETVSNSLTFPCECKHLLGDTNAGQGRKYVANHLSVYL